MTKPRKWDGKGSRQSRGYGAAWDRLRVAILTRDKWLCQECMRQGRARPLGVLPRDHAVDHITPKAQGGSDDPDNLQSLCDPCHTAKTARDEGWARPREVGLDGYPVG
ncbi:HNH endonuclease signature motif containing protein [Paracoccus sp. (in: a-proteobacteria)]|uniref:HNH endonuclease n=1 Tax=Paracoccus sp. TaxID=267 RepID=UPI00321F68F5